MFAPNFFVHPRCFARCDAVPSGLLVQGGKGFHPTVSYCSLTMPIFLKDLHLRPSTLQLLEQRGFMTLQEVQESRRLGVWATELGVSAGQAARLAAEIIPDYNQSSKIKSAAEWLMEQPREGAIVTFCRAIDQELLGGGGIALGEVTELAGAPGTGKTQWGMQLAVNTTLSKQYGGVEGECVYVDTEGSFTPDRCYTMANALITHVQHNIERRRRKKGQLTTCSYDVTPEQVLEGIHVFRVYDEAALMAVVMGALPQLIERRASAGTPVRLVVIDSIAFLYRAAPPDSDFVARTRQLTSMAAALTEMANKHHMAVVAVNQMTTKRASNGQNILVPALGESWAHAVSTRLVLSGTGKARTCVLTKSPRLPTGTAEYVVVEAGVRGTDYDETKDPAASKRFKM